MIQNSNQIQYDERRKPKGKSVETFNEISVKEKTEKPKWSLEEMIWNGISKQSYRI